MTAAAPALRLHVPDEPTDRRGDWYSRVLEGESVEAVVSADDGVAAWLWSRWQVLAGAGVTPEGFCDQVLGYRREVWLWLHGDRTWEQCCSGLIGRVERRLAAAAAADADA